MRSTVEFFITGSTLGEIMEGAKQRWQDFCGDENAALPTDSELQIRDSLDNGRVLTGMITIRTNVENK